MCGILALQALDPDAGVLPSATLGHCRAALDSMARRGPDGEGLVCVDEGRLYLGHRRLALIDRQHGGQPMTTLDGEIWASVNGEFYGDGDLRRELSAEGLQFSTCSDSEILLQLYKSRGLGALEYLRGEFAFVLWDARNRRLLAARDRFGVKPLWWARHANRLHIASQVDAVFRLGVPARWNEQSLAHVATYQYTPETFTPFAGIEQLPPGCLLISEGGHLEVQRYWQLEFSQPRSGFSGGSDPAKALYDALYEAVDLRLRGEHTPAFALSGGLDSTSVVVLAKARLGTKMGPGFCLAFDDPSYDESAAAARSAKRLGVECIAVPCSRGQLAAHFAEAVEVSGGWAINGQLPAKYLLNRAIHRAGFKVVLTGEGSDELLYGYPHLQLDYAPNCGVRPGVGTAGVMVPSTHTRSWPQLDAALGFTPSFIRAKRGLAGRFRSFLHPGVRTQIDDDRIWAELLDDDMRAGLSGCAGRAQKSAFLWTKLTLAGYILRTLGDGCEMPWSVEGRTPFLDHRFAHKAASIGPEMQIADGSGKLQLRKAMRSLLGSQAVQRPKQPLLAPPMIWTEQGGIDPCMLAILHDRAARDVAWLDIDRVRTAIEAGQTMPTAERAQLEPACLLALSAIVMQRHYAPSFP